MTARKRILLLAFLGWMMAPYRLVLADSETATAAPTQTLSPEMILLEQESQFQREKTEYLQQNILDKIIGPGKAVVIVDVEMGLQARNMEMQLNKNKTDKEHNPTDQDQPAPQSRELVPGVPMPKSVFTTEEDRGGSSKGSGGQLQQKKVEVQTTIKKLLITVLYDKKVSSDKLIAVKEAIIAMMKVTESQIVFTPTTFTQTAWQEVLTPKWIIPLSLALWLLLFLWGPLASFFRRLNRALEDKNQNITQATDMKQESENEEQSEEEGEAEGGGGSGLGPDGKPLEGEEAEKEGEEDMKKYEPFKYVTDKNLKRLAYLVRKEEPWIIALVLSYLKPEFAKEVLGSMPPELQARVAIETATIRQTSLEQVMSIDEYLKKKIDFVLGGLENLLKILDEADKTTRETILEYLKNEKPQLYERVREEVIMFEDLLKFPDAAIQVVVREVGTESLSRALRGASPEYMNKFFMNMSAGAAALLKESMDYGRQLTADQVEEERKKLLDIISKAERDGKISVRKKRISNMLEGEEAVEETEVLHLGQKPTAKPAAETHDRPKADEFLRAGAAYYEQGQYPEAIQNFHYAIQSDPAFWEAYQYLGSAYYAQGMVTEAMGAYERMLELNPNDPSLQAWVNDFKAQVAASGATQETV